MPCVVTLPGLIPFTTRPDAFMHVISNPVKSTVPIAAEFLKQKWTSEEEATLTSPQESESNDAVEGSDGGNKVSHAPREKQGIHKGVKSSEPNKNANDDTRTKQATLKTIWSSAY